MQEVYDYLKNEMLRVIDRYGVGWLKLDFNQELEVDPSGTGHMRYYQNLYRLIDELRQSRADVIFENCASGGLRSDINTMSHFDVSFSSDNANPWDGLSTFQQMSMRTNPNRIYRWLALQRGPDIPAYDRREGTVEHTVVTPSSPGPGFAECETIDTEFACRLLAQSPMGLTGDIATLDLPTRDCIRTHILFYQQWRCFLANASLLTDAEPARLGNRKSWHVHQFVEEACERSLIFVYRMNHICETRWVKVSGLEPLNRYRVSLFGEENAEVRTGASLLESGVAIRLARRNSSAIVIIEQV
jgi:alpha-galactosidase